VKLLSILAICAGAAFGGPIVFRNAKIFDGTKLLPPASVLVNGGKIVAIGEKIAVPAGAEVIEGGGGTLLPGLIDSHVHSFGDALKIAPIFGVTTVLDMGHGTEYGIKIQTISHPGEAQAFVDARIAEGSDYIKIVYHTGGPLPAISKATLAAVVAAAHKRKKMAVVHIGSQSDARDAISAGADGLVHLFVDSAPEPDFGQFVAAHHAFVIPTLTVLESVSGTPSGASLIDDANFKNALTPADISALKTGFPPSNKPHSYSFAEQTMKLLQAAHVPILAGTDAPNPGTMHGASLHRELELLQKAGLTPTEALAAATSVPAERFHLKDRGRIAPGLRADLLLVKGDPTTYIKATRNIIGVWKGGDQIDRAKYLSELAQQRAESEKQK
jgi:imidazolonepropionase-like amidohydrolase